MNDPLPYATSRDHGTVFGMGIHQVTSRRRTATQPRRPYREDMDGTPSEQDVQRPSLRDRLKAAGIPVPPPLTPAQREEWERQQDEADAQPRIYGPKTAA